MPNNYSNMINNAFDKANAKNTTTSNTQLFVFALDKYKSHTFDNYDYQCGWSEMRLASCTLGEVEFEVDIDGFSDDFWYFSVICIGSEAIVPFVVLSNWRMEGKRTKNAMKTTKKTWQKLVYIFLSKNGLNSQAKCNHYDGNGQKKTTKIAQIENNENRFPLKRRRISTTILCIFGCVSMSVVSSWHSPLLEMNRK